MAVQPSSGRPAARPHFSCGVLIFLAAVVGRWNRRVAAYQTEFRHGSIGNASCGGGRRLGGCVASNRGRGREGWLRRLEENPRRALFSRRPYGDREEPHG